MSENNRALSHDLLREEHFAIIDEYFNNGYNQTNAVLAFRPHLKPSTACGVFGAIAKKPDIKEYIVDKRHHLRASVNIEPEQVVNELINWVYSDPTQFLALTPEDVKALPPEVRRCIQSINYKKDTTYDKNGNKKEREVMDLKFIDKNKSVEVLNKMLGFYALDNKQKGGNVNVENLNINELKLLQQILTPVKE